jgi:hypothetical protein
MRVEHEPQKPSAQFWMGCTNNLEGNDVGQKLPYKHFTASAASTQISLTVLVVAHIFYCFNWL